MRKKINLPRPLGTPSLRGIFITAALALAACTADEPLPGDNNDNPQNNPLAGQLHIGSLTLDGASITSPTTRGWREATGEGSTRATTEDGSQGTNFEIPANRAITGFTQGDQLEIIASFIENDFSSTPDGTTTYNGATWSAITDNSGNPIKPNPEAFLPQHSWAKTSITCDYFSFSKEDVAGDGNNGYEDLRLALNLTPHLDIYRQSDLLYADQRNLDGKPSAGEYYVNTRLGSSTLGALIINLGHRHTLLRLPHKAIRISGYAPGFCRLHELVAKVGVSYNGSPQFYASYGYRFTPVTVNGKRYWQALVPAYLSGDEGTYTLTDFIAILGPEYPADYEATNFGQEALGLPGYIKFGETKDKDGNLLAQNNATLADNTPLKPITITLSEEVTMTRNTAHTLSLTLSPHTATVTVGSSTPGWGTEEDEEIIPSLIWTEEEKAAGIRKIGKGQGGQGYYEVISEAGLRTFADIVNGTGQYSSNPKPAASCILTADINLAGVTWIPIGTNGDGYTGTFDGSGHTISNLTVGRREQEVQGLFGSITNATVKNLTIKDGRVTGFYYIGAIAGSATNSTIENCHNLGVTINTQGGAYAGGIVGYTTATTLTACTNTGSVSGTSNIGGIVGWNRSALTACVNTGSVSGTTYAGSIVGWNSNYILTACFWLQDTATAAIGQNDGTDDTDGVEMLNKTSTTQEVLDEIAARLKILLPGYTFTPITLNPSQDILPGTVLFTVTEVKP